MKSFNVDVSSGLKITLEKVKSPHSIKGISLIPMCPGVDAVGLIPCEIPDSKAGLPHPADVQIMRDIGGSGDGDLWLPSFGEFEKSPNTRTYTAEVPIDMSSDELPSGMQMELFQSSVFPDIGDLEFSIPLKKETYNVTLLFCGRTIASAKA